MKFTIIEDTREKEGWTFGIFKECAGVVRQKLDAGDYTTQEILAVEQQLEKKILRIERKRTTGELCNNLTGQGWERFKRVLKEMSEFEHKYLILEFDIPTVLKFPEDSGIPKNRWFRRNAKGEQVKNIKMNGKFMMVLINKIEIEFGVPVVFANNRNEATAKAVEFIQQVHDAYKERIPE